MTLDKLEKGWDMHEEIQRRKNDLQSISKTPVISCHGCTRQPTDNEKKLDEKIKKYSLKVVGDELSRLEKEFAKL